MAFRIRRAREGSERGRAFALRHEVFVLEQQRVPPELERDAQDEAADHVVAVDAADRVVATGRLVALDARTGKVGRMAVARAERGLGAGTRRAGRAQRIARERGLTEVVLSAQLSAQGFYYWTGYRAEGPIFEEAGIQHVLMRKSLSGRAASTEGSP